MRPNYPFGILSSLVLMGTAALSSTVAHADPLLTVRTRSVNFTRADLNDPVATQALYRRLQRAATIVCERPIGREIDRYGQFKRCYDNAVQTAVESVNAAPLTAVHHTKSQRFAAR